MHAWSIGSIGIGCIGCSTSAKITVVMDTPMAATEKVAFSIMGISVN